MQPNEVDREAVAPGERRRRLGEVDFHIGTVRAPVEAARQQLVGRNPVQLGEAQQTRDRDRTLAALVGTQHRRLELLAGPGLDVVE